MGRSGGEGKEKIRQGEIENRQNLKMNMEMQKEMRMQKATKIESIFCESP